MEAPATTQPDEAISINLRQASSGRNRWDTVEQILKMLSSLAVMLSSVAVPIVVAVIGLHVQQQLQDQAVRRDYVTLAASILREPDATKSPQDLKAWAADLLDQNSPTKLPLQLKQRLQSGSVTLPGVVLVSGAIGVSPDTIRPGESAKLSWNSFNADSVLITPDIGAVPLTGTIDVSPKSTTTYTMTISNAGGSNTVGTVTVHVKPK